MITKILIIIKCMQQLPQRQRGAALMVMLVILIIGATAMLLNSLNAMKPRLERDKITANALSQAKEALIGYAAKDSNRPGELPCPDVDGDGQITTAGDLDPGPICKQFIGYLPWKTLGLPELRDGSNSKLWYAISQNFYAGNTVPLNSDTLGTLTVTGSTSANNVVAIVFAPGTNINGQSRSEIKTIACSTTMSTVAESLCATNYLDGINANPSPAAAPNTIYTSTNISDIFNDQLLVITPIDIFRVVEKRVAITVANALNDFFCGIGNPASGVGCVSAGGNRYYPSPANFNDVDCLGITAISSVPVLGSGCVSAATNYGRIPASGVPSWDSTSILRGTIGTGNWFQSNGWRELIFYAVAPACTNGTIDCVGGPVSFLTLNNPLGTTQKAIVIATGSALSTTLPAQAHSSPAAKTTLSNYLEDENLIPLDNIYTNSASSPFNDYATGTRSTP